MPDSKDGVLEHFIESNLKSYDRHQFDQLASALERSRHRAYYLNDIAYLAFHYSSVNWDLARKYAELSLKHDADHVESLRVLAVVANKQEQFDEAIAYCDRLLGLADRPVDALYALHIKISALLEEGVRRSHVLEVWRVFRSTIQELVLENPMLEDAERERLALSIWWFPHFSDDPDGDRPLIQSIVRLARG